MDVVWDKGEAAVSDVVESLQTDPPLAYNTVLTTMRILEDKGYLTHQKLKDGRAFMYSPTVGREEATRKAVRNLVSRFFHNSPELLVLNVLKDDELSAAELKRIRKLITEEGRK